MPDVGSARLRAAQGSRGASFRAAAPRHLGVHSGGMVITKAPVSEIVPVE
ncbi:hypothetical protein [Amycolatopsis sp. NPDC051372]